MNRVKCSYRGKPEEPVLKNILSGQTRDCFFPSVSLKRVSFTTKCGRRVTKCVNHCVHAYKYVSFLTVTAYTPVEAQSVFLPGKGKRVKPSLYYGAPQLTAWGTSDESIRGRRAQNPSRSRPERNTKVPERGPVSCLHPLERKHATTHSSWHTALDLQSVKAS